MKSRTITTLVFCIIVLFVLPLLFDMDKGTPIALAAPASNFIVDNTGADPDSNPGDGTCATTQGACTLYAAIQEANANPVADTIIFADTIGEIHLYQPLPLITDNGTTIDGGGLVELICNNNTEQAIVVSANENCIQGLYINSCDIAILVMGGYYNILGVAGDIIGPAQANHLDNNGIGIDLAGGENTSISGNTITNSLVEGIRIEASSAHNMIGVVDTAMFRDDMPNMINDNTIGIKVEGNYNLLAGNNVQFNDYGIWVDGNSNRVGTNDDGINDAEEINWVHHNLVEGLTFTMGSSSNTLAGNYIGTGEGGLGDAGNKVGVRMGGTLNIAGPDHDGVSDDLERNIISGNNTGMLLNCWECTIRGNYFGLDVTGDGAVGNAEYAIQINGNTNTVGGEEAWQANRIMYTGGDGIAIKETASGNQLLGNLISENGNLGIDLVPIAQVNPNDEGDLDGGANNGQNYPILSSVTTDGSALHILGSFNSLPSRQYRLEFYANDTCDASGYGEGQTFIEYTIFNTDGYGNATFDRTPPGSYPVGTAITAIAIDRTTGDTSEFSACALVTAGPVNGTMVVNSTADQVDLDPIDAVCDTGDDVGGEPECTLRAAIQQANASPGVDYIELPAGNYGLTILGTSENEAVTGDLDINDDLTISGAGANVTFVDGGGLDRVFDIGPTNNTAQVTLQHITIQHGGGDGVLTGQGVGNRASLDLNACVVRENGGTYGSIYNFPGGSLALENSTVRDNATTGNGAGIYAQNSVYIKNSTISGNVSNNNGGGIFVNSGTVYVYNSTIANNTADADDDDAGQGGGIYNNGATVYLDNSLVVNNLDLSDGGNRNGTEAFDCYGAFVSGGYNTVTDIAEDDGADPLCTGFDSQGDVTSGFWLFGQYLVYNVQLEPLALNGGTTPSHRPLLDEDLFVIDTANPLAPGDPAACQSTDQRGLPRPYDGDGDGEARCDRGSYEASLSLLSVTNSTVDEAGQATFNVELYPASPITVTVSYTTSSGTATAGSDFTEASSTLTFEPGETSRTITISTLADSLDEEDEIFFVGLSEPDSAALGQAQAIGTISDDDAEPNLSIVNVSVNEGDSGTVQALFTVSLSTASGKQVQVQYSSQDGSADSLDYLPAAGLLTFEPGETSLSFIVSVLGDTLDETNEHFSLILSEAVNAGLSDSEAVCTIVDDDGTMVGYITFLPMLKK